MGEPGEGRRLELHLRRSLVAGCKGTTTLVACAATFRAAITGSFRLRAGAQERSGGELKSSLVKGQGSNAASLPRELTGAAYWPGVSRPVVTRPRSCFRLLFGRSLRHHGAGQEIVGRRLVDLRRDTGAQRLGLAVTRRGDPEGVARCLEAGSATSSAARTTSCRLLHALLVLGEGVAASGSRRGAVPIQPVLPGLPDAVFNMPGVRVDRNSTSTLTEVDLGVDPTDIP